MGPYTASDVEPLRAFKGVHLEGDFLRFYPSQRLAGRDHRAHGRRTGKPPPGSSAPSIRCSSPARPARKWCSRTGEVGATNRRAACVAIPSPGNDVVLTHRRRTAGYRRAEPRGDGRSSSRPRAATSCSSIRGPARSWRWRRRRTAGGRRTAWRSPSRSSRARPPSSSRPRPCSHCGAGRFDRPVERRRRCTGTCRVPTGGPAHHRTSTPRRACSRWRRRSRSRATSRWRSSPRGCRPRSNTSSCATSASARRPAIELPAESPGHPAPPGSLAARLHAGQHGDGIRIRGHRRSSSPRPTRRSRNDGMLLTPTLVREVRDAGRHGALPPPAGAGAPGRHAGGRGAAPGVPARGGGRGRHRARRPSWSNYQVLGKTGTARRLRGRPVRATQYTASFAAIFPADDPQLVVVVRDRCDRTRAAIYGGDVAAPVMRTMLEQALASRRTAFDRAGSTAERCRAGPRQKPPADRPPPHAGRGACRCRRATRSGGAATVPDVAGSSVRAAALALHRRGFRVTVDGSGAVRSGRIPPPAHRAPSARPSPLGGVTTCHGMAMTC